SNCKHNNPPIVPPPAPSTLLFHLHTNVDTMEYVYGDTALTSDGRKVILTLAQLYISGINMIKADGSSIEVPAVLLKKAENENNVVGNLAPGNYTHPVFNIGLNSIDNAKDPSGQNGNDPLSNQKPPMWFGSSSQGYIFLNLQGMID